MRISLIGEGVMTRRCITIVAMTTAILLAQVIVDAQQNSADPTLGTLAVEIVNDDKPASQFPVLGPTEGGFMEIGPSRQLSDWKQPAGVLPLARIRIHSLMEDNAVRINVSAVFDDSWPVDSTGAKYGAREQPIASYLAKEGETISVQELKRFGVEPLLLKVVRAELRRDEEQPFAFQPAVVSKVKSVEVIAVVASGSDPSAPTRYQVSLRNLTSKNITALEIYESEQGRRGGSETMMQSVPGRPVIGPGAMYDTEVSIGGTSGRMTPQGFVPDPQKQRTFVVGTVVFEDGTFEGEVVVAAGIEARQAGRRIQLGRVVLLLRDTLDAADQGEAAALEKLKSQVSLLRIDVDASIISELLSRFPSLADETEKKRLMGEVMDGLKNGREEILHKIKEFEQSTDRSTDFRAWLSRTKEKYEAMTSSF